MVAGSRTTAARAPTRRRDEGKQQAQLCFGAARGGATARGATAQGAGEPVRLEAREDPGLSSAQPQTQKRRATR